MTICGYRIISKRGYKAVRFLTEKTDFCACYPIVCFLMKYLRVSQLCKLLLKTCFSHFLVAVGAMAFAFMSGCMQLNSSNHPVLPAPQASTAEFAYEADAGLLLLLVPQGQILTAPMVTAWTDAGSELGIRIRPVTDQQFKSLGPNALKYAGLILPDQLHTVADDELVKAIRVYTQAGGNTLLVHNFGTLVLDGNGQPTYPIPSSRLSELAGVDYALYHTLREKSAVVGTVMAMGSMLRELQVPPGKSSPYLSPKNLPIGMGIGTSTFMATSTGRPSDSPGSYVPNSSVTLSRAQTAGASGVGTDALESYSGYLLGNLIYPSFVTQGSFNGVVLATSAEAGLVAGLNKVGRGQVLFVNLPLTDLKVARTDGLPMHGFLRYFAHNVLQMAHLSAVPDAVAGLTLNWHLDSFAAQLPTLKLEKLGVFDDGPFSINMTTGPDAVSIGDGKGWNLDNNPVAQNILQRFAAKGHALGSHGGWNHDYYGLNANDTNSDTFLPYLEKNTDSIKRAVSHPLRPFLGFTTSTPRDMPPFLLPTAQKLKSWTDQSFGPLLREYSPPVGNNPKWAMDWLEGQGVVAAYFAGHTGMGPTRQYRDGQLSNPDMWVFPVTPFGRYATFEEFQTANLPKKEVIDWYRNSVDFAIAHNTTRMIYMHPNGADVWPDVLLDLLAHANAYGEHKFRWYTMTRLADFMTTRRGVTWTEQRSRGGTSKFEISHSSSLSEMVWLLPKARYTALPFSKDGSVTVSDQGANWAVRGGNSRRASFTAVNPTVRK